MSKPDEKSVRMILHIRGLYLKESKKHTAHTFAWTEQIHKYNALTTALRAITGKNYKLKAQ